MAATRNQYIYGYLDYIRELADTVENLTEAKQYASAKELSKRFGDRGRLIRQLLDQLNDGL